MKPLTYVITIIHLIYVICVMWFGPLLIHFNVPGCKKHALYILYLFAIGIQVIHWGFSSMQGECILSILEKRSEDPEYVVGSDPKKTFIWEFLNTFVPCVSVHAWRQFHMVVSKTSCYFALFLLTIGNDCWSAVTCVKTMLWVICSIFVTCFVSFDSAYHSHRL